MSVVACTAFTGLCLEENLYNDVIINVDGIEFNANKMILMNCSPYFGALFSSTCSNAEKGYTIPGMLPETMRLILEFAYTGTTPVTADNVESLLISANEFNIMGLIQLCCEFLKSQLCLENCVGIWRFTDYYYCPDLQEAAYVFILQHFEEMTRVSAEFLELNFIELEDMLGKGGVHLKEEAVFEALLKWVAHDVQNRRQHIVFLLSKEGWRDGQKGYFFIK